MAQVVELLLGKCKGPEFKTPILQKQREKDSESERHAGESVKETKTRGRDRDEGR
jgi:hypothetical protein